MIVDLGGYRKWERCVLGYIRRLTARERGLYALECSLVTLRIAQDI
jgi:hypothetical protein